MRAWGPGCRGKLFRRPRKRASAAQQILLSVLSQGVGLRAVVLSQDRGRMTTLLLDDKRGVLAAGMECGTSFRDSTTCSPAALKEWQYKSGLDG